LHTRIRPPGIAKHADSSVDIDDYRAFPPCPDDLVDRTSLSSGTIEDGDVLDSLSHSDEETEVGGQDGIEPNFKIEEIMPI
jgi:hypothetical protein